MLLALEDRARAHVRWCDENKARARVLLFRCIGGTKGEKNIAIGGGFSRTRSIHFSKCDAYEKGEKCRRYEMRREIAREGERERAARTCFCEEMRV